MNKLTEITFQNEQPKSKQKITITELKNSLNQCRPKQTGERLRTLEDRSSKISGLRNKKEKGPKK